MARLQKLVNPEISKYRDRRFEGNQEDFERTLRESTTVYVGNLSFFTTEEQIYEVFSKAGDIKRIVMGLDKVRHTPCGFCFVVYYTRADTEDCVKYINGMALDERLIRVDFDWGFRDGRQFGRGKSGGQVRDEYRMDHDEGRGGFGHIKRQALEARLAALQHQSRMYGEGQDADEEPNGSEPPASVAAAATAADTTINGSDEPGPKRRRRDSDDDEDG